MAAPAAQDRRPETKATRGLGLGKIRHAKFGISQMTASAAQDRRPETELAGDQGIQDRWARIDMQSVVFDPSAHVAFPSAGPPSTLNWAK